MIKLRKFIVAYILGISMHLIPFTANGAIQSLVFADFNVDRVEGFAQTPRGGDIGTTSFNRPSFEEMNIHHDKFYDIGASISYCDYIATLEYFYLYPHGSSVLQQDLISHAQFISEGMRFDMDIEYDWFILSLGKKYPFHWFTVSPMIQLNWLKYDYQFSAPPQASSRSYSLLALDLGIKICRDFTSTISGEIMGSVTIPLFNLKIYTLSAGLTYQLLTSSHIKVIPRMTLGTFRFDYEDKQTVPNHFRYTANIFGSIGLAILFT